VPELIDVVGVPEIVGDVFGFDETLIENEGKVAVTLPSLTLIAMPTCNAAVVGVPVNRPVVLENVAHVGRLTIEKVSGSPLASLAAGWNVYALPATTVVAGVPEIVGGAFGRGDTLIENAGKAVLTVPSFTAMTILECVAAVVGVPLKRPVELENVAQAGAFVIVKFSVLPSASEAVG
jgi:hypothetical protein